MPVIQVNDKQHTLKAGQTRVGAGPGVDVSVSNDPGLGLQAIFELAPDNHVIIRRARDGAAVRVNGVALAEPTPLIHGDKVDVAGVEILFSEDKKVGATAFVSAKDVAGIISKRSGPARATAGTGGRLVSLVDGKEYNIPAQGITFGREAGSDVVVAQPEVSRKHATIAPADNGYILTDHSTNGVWVNGTRVQSMQLLARSDVVRVGSEEFRFYADVVSKATPVAGSPQAGAPPGPPPTPRPPATQPAATPANASANAPVAAAAGTAGTAGAIEPPTVPASVAAQAGASASGSSAPSSAAPAPASQSFAPPKAPTPPAPPAPPVEPTVPVPTIRPQPPAEPTAPVPVISSAAKQEEPRRDAVKRDESRRAASAPPATSTPHTPAARAQTARPKREPTTASGANTEEKRTGLPSWVWIAIILVVGVAAYFLGQGRG